MLPIDREIGIQSQNGVPIVNLRHADNACISQRHRRVAILLKQLTHDTCMLIEPECDPECAIFEKFEQRILRPCVTGEQIHCLGEYRLTDEKRCVEFFDALCNPSMLSFRSVEKGDQRPGINDGDGHFCRSP